MKKFTGIIVFAFFYIGFTSGQETVTDSIVNAQPDSLLRVKLIKFFSNGAEQILPVDTLTPDDLISSAWKYLGTPHCMGGNGMTTKDKKGRTCIDCSGLINASLFDLGIKTGIHNAQEFARYGKIIADTSQIKKGDLLFFIQTYHPSDKDIFITHAGIAVSNNLMIHTSASHGVEIIPINGVYWKSRFLFATRVLK